MWLDLLPDLIIGLLFLFKFLYLIFFSFGTDWSVTSNVASKELHLLPPVDWFTPDSHNDGGQCESWKLKADTPWARREPPSLLSESAPAESWSWDPEPRHWRVNWHLNHFHPGVQLFYLNPFDRQRLNYKRRARGYRRLTIFGSRNGHTEDSNQWVITIIW